jgi:hypothetical protein
MDRKQEVLSKLCALCTEVGDKVFNHHSATDCFCGKIDTAVTPEHFHFEQPVLDFILKAVKEKIELDEHGQLMRRRAVDRLERAKRSLEVAKVKYPNDLLLFNEEVELATKYLASFD